MIASNNQPASPPKSPRAVSIYLTVSRVATLWYAVRTNRLRFPTAAIADDDSGEGEPGRTMTMGGNYTFWHKAPPPPPPPGALWENAEDSSDDEIQNYATTVIPIPAISTSMQFVD